MSTWTWTGRPDIAGKTHDCKGMHETIKMLQVCWPGNKSLSMPFSAETSPMLPVQGNCIPDGYVFTAHGCPIHDLILGDGFTLIVCTAASTCGVRQHQETQLSHHQATL